MVAMFLQEVLGNGSTSLVAVVLKHFVMRTGPYLQCHYKNTILFTATPGCCRKC